MPWCRGQDNIKKDPKESGWVSVGWINVVQNVRIADRCQQYRTFGFHERRVVL